MMWENVMLNWNKNGGKTMTQQNIALFFVLLSGDGHACV